VPTACQPSSGFATGGACASATMAA
jgi:hypothetical protein